MNSKMIVLGVITLVFSFSIAYSSGLFPSPGHPASEIGPGTFWGTGTAGLDNWIFPGTVKVDAPLESTDVATKGYVDALSGSGVSASGMPLRGNIIYHDDYSSTNGVAVIPLSLPKENCGVKITTCGSGGYPVAKVLVSSDPINAIIRDKEYTTSWASGRIPITVPLSGSSCAAGGRIYISGSCFLDYYGCCPEGYVFDNNHGCDCVECPSTYPNADYRYNIYPIIENPACFKEPKCPVVAGEILKQETNYNPPYSKCIYCPEDHPAYDTGLRKCFKDSDNTASIIGRCSTTDIILESSFTDIAFRTALDTTAYANFVAISYSCPE